MAMCPITYTVSVEGPGGWRVGTRGGSLGVPPCVGWEVSGLIAGDPSERLVVEAVTIDGVGLVPTFAVVLGDVNLLVVMSVAPPDGSAIFDVFGPEWTWREEGER